MIAKLVTYGKDRTEAMDIMRKALNEYKVVGLKNNLKFVKRIFDDAIFQNGEYDTGFIEQNVETLLKKDKIDNFLKLASVICRNSDKSTGIKLPSESNEEFFCNF